MEGTCIITLGQLVRSALAACRVNEHVPDLRNYPEGKRRLARLHELAGVRSERGYGRGTRHVSLYWDDSGRDMELTPSEADRSGGFSGLAPQATLQVGADIDDAGLGAAIRRALAACITIP
jgi:hypothetical protein